LNFKIGKLIHLNAPKHAKFVV